MAAPKLGKTSCDQCPANSASSVDLTDFLCKPGYYFILEQPGNVSTCADCPVGADCTMSGTTLQNVVPLPGYAPDIGFTNRTFIKCLNTACGAATSTAPAPAPSPVPASAASSSKGAGVNGTGVNGTLSPSSSSPGSGVSLTGARVVVIDPVSGLPVSPNPNCAPGYDGPICTKVQCHMQSRTGPS
jgi:hypothetical protein